MSELDKFCDERGATQHIKEAFTSYCRSVYSHKFNLRNGETMKFAITKLNRSEIEEAWQDFVKDLKKLLSE